MNQHELSSEKEDAIEKNHKSQSFVLPILKIQPTKRPIKGLKSNDYTIISNYMNAKLIDAQPAKVKSKKTVHSLSKKKHIGEEGEYFLETIKERRRKVKKKPSAEYKNKLRRKFSPMFEEDPNDKDQNSNKYSLETPTYQYYEGDQKHERSETRRTKK